MIGRPISYSEEELRFVKRFCKLPRKELAKRFNAKFERDVETSNIQSLCSKQKWRGWIFQARGSVSGYFGYSVKPLYSEKIKIDGRGCCWVMIKVPKQNLQPGQLGEYVLKHHWLWQQEYGKIPKGKTLKFKDGNKKNCALGNLVLIDRSILPALNRRGYDNAPDECKPLILNVCRLQQTIGERKKERK